LLSHPVTHIRQKLQEADFFLDGMRHFSELHEEEINRGATAFAPNTYPILRRFQYNFSAMLSAWQCVMNYMQTQYQSPEAQAWYKKAAQQKLIEAYSALRHSDIHDETVGLSHYTHFEMHNDGQATMTTGIKLHKEMLQQTPRLGNRPKVVEYLCGTCQAVSNRLTSSAHDLEGTGIVLSYIPREVVDPRGNSFSGVASVSHAVLLRSRAIRLVSSASTAQSRTRSPASPIPTLKMHFARTPPPTPTSTTSLTAASSSSTSRASASRALRASSIALSKSASSKPSSRAPSSAPD